MLAGLVDKQDKNMAHLSRKVVAYQRDSQKCCIEIIESQASKDQEQYAIDMTSQAMREFCDKEMTPMASFVRD